MARRHSGEEHGLLLGNGNTTLANLDVNTVHEGLATVLASNIGLLNGFVGEDLVLPLMQQAWGVSGASGNMGDQ